MNEGNRLLVGRYALRTPLGEGGMGVVWRARDTLLGRVVAIKQVRLPAELPNQRRAGTQQRILREARAAARLNHPGAVTVHDVVQDGGEIFIVMELVEAPNLEQVVARQGPLPAERAARLGLEIPAVTIPGVTIPGVDVPGVRRPAVSTPAVSGGPRTEPARHADEVCQLKPRGGGLAPAVVRPAVVRQAVVRPAVVRQAVVRPAACHDLDCAEAIAVPAVVADAVVVDAVVVDAEVIDAKVFPEAPKAQVLQGAGTTTYVLRADLLFDFNKADIRPDATVTLRQVAASIARRFPGARLEIDGHTDSVGGDAYNLDLSLRRARAVVGWLGRNGHLDAGRMTTRGYGESKPVAPNTRRDGSDNPTGRQLNRRVAIGVLRG